MSASAHTHHITLTGDDHQDKLKQSTFLLTINSNQVVTSMKDPFVRTFKQQIHTILSNIPEYIAVNSGFIPDPEMIINIRPVFEIGEKQKRLHVHVVIDIKHNSNIKIDTGKITEQSGYYCNSTYIRGHVDLQRALRYIKKHM
jgi:hypothetical protein